MNAAASRSGFAWRTHSRIAPKSIWTRVNRKSRMPKPSPNDSSGRTLKKRSASAGALPVSTAVTDSMVSGCRARSSTVKVIARDEAKPKQGADLNIDAVDEQAVKEVVHAKHHQSAKDTREHRAPEGAGLDF